MEEMGKALFKLVSMIDKLQIELDAARLQLRYERDHISKLEKELKLEAAIERFTAEQLYSAAKDANLHSVNIDDLIGAIVAQREENSPI